MFKKILAIGMALTLIMASGAIITLAEVEHDGQIVKSGSKTYEAIDTDYSYGAIADPSETAGAGSASISVDDDVTVNYSGIGETSTAYEDIYGAGAISDTHDDQTSVKVGGDVTVTNNSNSNLDTTGVSAKSDGNHAKAEATVGGDITVTNNNSPHENTGIRASAEGEGAAASVTAGGNVSVKGTDGDANGVIANAGSITDVDEAKKGATVSVNVTGNVTANSTNAEAYGVTAGAMVENSSATVNITGNVSAASTNGGAYGITTVAEGENASVKVTVGGDVSSSSTNGEGAYGIYTENIDDGSIDITLEKNLAVTGPIEASSGIMIMSGNWNSSGNDTSSTKINIRGDLNSSGSGIAVMQESGTVDVVIEGTVNSKTDAVVLGSSNGEFPTENLNITVWEIKSGNDSIVGIADFGDFSNVSEETRKAVEKSINYIIRIDDNYKNNISVSNTRTINNLDTAREEETVNVMLNIPEGYRLVGAYSDVAHNVQLKGDSRSGYYLSVPRGGGVYVSLSLTEIEGYYDRDDEDDGDGTYKTPENFIGNIPISTLSDDDFKFDENTGILTISIPYGTEAFNLSSEVLLSFISKGMNTLYLDTAGLKYTIPVTNIQDLLIAGNVLTFVFREQNLDILLSTTLVRAFYPDPKT